MPWVELAVRDTGTGMDAETQAHLFEPFFTTKEPGKGTGLGLATILGIIRGAGGRIDVDSTLGRGTTFTIRLPGATAPVDEHGPIIAPAESAAQRGASTGGAKPTILVVEDEEAIRRVMRRVLEASGYDVIEAEDGESALAAITRHGGALALMITDMMLPGMTGGELVAQLRQIQPTVPVVLTSGYSADFALERAGIGEGVVFLGKPFALDELVRTVRAVVPRTA
ncbi:MAG: response regulator [Gemmatimonadales bacterium]